MSQSKILIGAKIAYSVSSDPKPGNLSMIAIAPHYSSVTETNYEFEYLLLGDLRQVLDEPSGPQTSRWLIAILDMVLVGRSPVPPSVYLPIRIREDRYKSLFVECGSLFEKLRRLRDRVAHRAAHAALALEIRDELREVMLDRINSAGCLYDA